MKSFFGFIKRNIKNIILISWMIFISLLLLNINKRVDSIKSDVSSIDWTVGDIESNVVNIQYEVEDIKSEISYR